MMKEKYQVGERFNSQAGIAIGPILFIIAILAILAAAIAAGSGSFNAPTATEGNKTKAAALIQVGENLKIGMDRLTMENGVAWGGYIINAASTVNQNDLFAPAGGGISSPSPSLAGDPSVDVWEFPTGAVPLLGTPAEEQLAVLNVTQGVCDEVNNRANGQVTPPTADLGDFTTADVNAETSVNWPTNLQGKVIGCVLNGSKWYFYEVLYIQ